MEEGESTTLYRDKYYVLLWRSVAIVESCIWIAKFLLIKYLFGFDIPDDDIITEAFLTPLYFGTIAATCFLIAFPLKLYVHSLFVGIWAFVHLLEGKTILGLVELILCVVFSYQQGYLTKHFKIKIAIISVCAFAAIIVQTVFSFLRFGTIMLRLLDFALVVGITAMCFLKRKIERNKTERASPKSTILSFPAEHFTSLDVQILQMVLDGEKYEHIAHVLNISESTVKIHLRRSYRFVGVDSKLLFTTKYTDHTVVLEQ